MIRTVHGVNRMAEDLATVDRQRPFLATVPPAVSLVQVRGCRLTEREGGGVRLDVVDEGRGISPQDAERVFERVPPGIRRRRG